MNESEIRRQIGETCYVTYDVSTGLFTIHEEGDPGGICILLWPEIINLYRFGILINDVKYEVS